MSPGGSAIPMPTDAASAAAAGTSPRNPASPTAVLTARLARGDEAAWHDFHAAYAPRLYRYLLVVARGDETRAADALQATFVRAAKHVRTFDSEDVLWSWLTALARSAAVDEHRRSSRFLGFLTRFKSSTPAPAPAPAHEPESHLGDLLERGLEQLDAPGRHLLTRKYIDDASVRTIAAELGTTEKAIESKLARAREKLRSLVLKKLERPGPQ